METTPPQGIRQGQRTLAAIVFTDVVSFSARMQADEETTLRLLQRDFTVMREISARHDGQVLKTTGDGLLLYFASAVQAVACALAMQRQFAEQARELPAAEVLTHRIGIHLGDVFLDEQDVMGDGVNIASRLQAEAEPGGICISQTVYDVVKNKLALQAISLGPRELKNIAQAVPVYRILLEAQGFDVGRMISAQPRVPWYRRFPRIRRRHAVIALGALGTVVVVWLLGTGLARVLRPSPRPSAVLAEVARVLPAAARAEALSRPYFMQRDAMLQMDSLLEGYDFDGMARYIRVHTERSAAAPAAARAAQGLVEQMAAMRVWLISALRAYSRERPLKVVDLSNPKGRPLAVYLAADLTWHFVEGGADRARSWQGVSPPIMGSIVISALRDARAAPPAGAAMGVHGFAWLYNLPQVMEAVRSAGPPVPRP